MTADEGRVSSALSHALDTSRRQPCLRTDVEFTVFTTRRGSRTAVAHRVGFNDYLRFNGDEADILRALDGSRNLDALSSELGRPVGQVEHVVSALRGRGLLTDGGTDVYATVQTALAPKPGRVSGRAVGWMRNPVILIPRADEVVSRLYRSGGRFLSPES